MRKDTLKIGTVNRGKLKSKTYVELSEVLVFVRKYEKQLNEIKKAIIRARTDMGKDKESKQILNKLLHNL